MNPIGWCEETWAPYDGCNKVSPGCENCYAIRMSWRLAHNPKTKASYEGVVKKTDGGKLNWTGVINRNNSQFDKPLRAKKPTMFFINSMSDVFHEALTFEQIDELFDIMNACPRHTFQVLTKRHKHMLEYFKWKEAGNGFKFTQWPLKNVWLGVSVENQKYADERIPYLLQCPAAIRFLSCEPLLGAVDLVPFSQFDYCENNIDKEHNNCTGCKGDGVGSCNAVTKLFINWIIVGGESGPDARPAHPSWIRQIIEQCKCYSIPVYFKQWGAYRCLLPEDMQLPSENGLQLKKGIKYKVMQDDTAMILVGKHNAGNTIDGKQYLEFPKIDSQAKV